MEMETSEVLTNSALYEFVVSLGEARRETSRTLEDYLRSLFGIVSEYRVNSGLTGPQLAGALLKAFDAPVAPYEPAWESEIPYDNGEGPELTGWAAFEQRLANQVVDLRDMRRVGILEDKHKYFGVTAPKGGRWYNFDPAGFLECAAEGAFGGWTEESSSGRQLVPGPVAATAPDGSFVEADPKTIPREESRLGLLSWEQLAHFLFMGQVYE